MRISLLFLIFLALEVASIIQAGSLLGAFGAIGLLVLDLVIGGVLFDVQSRRLGAFRLRGRAAAVGPLPALSLYLAAFLFAFPGFVSDVFALLLIFQPTRLLLLASAGQFLLKRLGPKLRRMPNFHSYGFGAGSPQGGFTGAGATDNSAGSGDDIIEGEFRDVTDLRDHHAPGGEALPEEAGPRKRGA